MVVKLKWEHLLHQSSSTSNFLMILIRECYILDRQISTDWFLFWLLGNNKYYNSKYVVFILIFKLLLVIMRI